MNMPSQIRSNALFEMKSSPLAPHCTYTVIIIFSHWYFYPISRNYFQRHNSHTLCTSSKTNWISLARSGYLDLHEIKFGGRKLSENWLIHLPCRTFQRQRISLKVSFWLCQTFGIRILRWVSCAAFEFAILNFAIINYNIIIVRRCHLISWLIISTYRTISFQWWQFSLRLQNPLEKKGVGTMQHIQVLKLVSCIWTLNTFWVFWILEMFCNRGSHHNRKYEPNVLELQHGFHRTNVVYVCLSVANGWTASISFIVGYDCRWEIHSYWNRSKNISYITHHNIH